MHVFLLRSCARWANILYSCRAGPPADADNRSALSQHVLTCRMDDWVPVEPWGLPWHTTLPVSPTSRTSASVLGFPFSETLATSVWPSCAPVASHIQDGSTGYLGPFWAASLKFECACTSECWRSALDRRVPKRLVGHATSPRWSSGWRTRFKHEKLVGNSGEGTVLYSSVTVSDTGLP